MYILISGALSKSGESSLTTSFSNNLDVKYAFALSTHSNPCKTCTSSSLTNKSFDLPEFNSLEVAKNFINILDKKEMVADMLDSGFAEDIKVYIGEENEKEQLKDFSVVTFKHKVNGKDLGTIGIIGPKRMDYSKVISVMKYINQKLNGKSN